MLQSGRWVRFTCGSARHSECCAGAGTECAVFHWLATSTIDELFEKYAKEDAITFEAFKRLVRLSLK